MFRQLDLRPRWVAVVVATPPPQSCACCSSRTAFGMLPFAAIVAAKPASGLGPGSRTKGMGDMAKLDGRTCIVTGGGHGIGRGIALRLAAEGAQVGVLDIDDAKAESVAGQIGVAGGEALAAHCDVSDRRSVRADIGSVVDRFRALT
jgi:5,10-methylene-tetrahydrofolate dehydrogenase/methenyl tetrahydrofolate cyclohydrolase